MGTRHDHDPRLPVALKSRVKGSPTVLFYCLFFWVFFPKVLEAVKESSKKSLLVRVKSLMVVLSSALCQHRGQAPAKFHLNPTLRP